MIVVRHDTVRITISQGQLADDRHTMVSESSERRRSRQAARAESRGADQV